jgi:hypothetical protein
MHDVLIVLILVTCALAPWLLPAPSRWSAWRSSRGMRAPAGREVIQPTVQYVRQSRGSRRGGSHVA